MTAQHFRGESTHKIDAKGRVSIPADFRRVLEAEDPEWKQGVNFPQLVIVYGDERRNFLECFTVNAIAGVDAKILRMPRWSPKRRSLERFYQGYSMRTSVDDSGRLVLPPKRRQKIGLEGEAYFIGQGDTFEIWKPDTFEADFLAAFSYGENFDPTDFDPKVDPAVYLDGDD